MFRIDQFRQGDRCDGCFYILTHAHTDHAKVPKRFPSPIYCSDLTLKLLPGIPQLVGSLRPGCAIMINGMKVIVFDSRHCPGSIGIYCNGLLHWGDGRPTETLVESLRIRLGPNDRINTIACDSRASILGDQWPTMEESSVRLMHAIERHKTARIEMRHFGQLALLNRLKGSVQFILDMVPTGMADLVFVRCWEYLDLGRQLVGEANGPTAYISRSMPHGPSEYPIITISSSPSRKADHITLVSHASPSEVALLKSLAK